MKYPEGTQIKWKSTEAYQTYTLKHSKDKKYLVTWQDWQDPQGNCGPAGEAYYTEGSLDELLESGTIYIWRNSPGVDLQGTVPSEFIYANAGGGLNTYRATWNGSFFEVKAESGPKTGLGERTIQYAEADVRKYLFETKEWVVREVVATKALRSKEFLAKFEIDGHRYEAKSIEEACKLLGQIRALKKMEETLARKRKT